MELFKPGRQFDFMAMRWFWIPLSIFLVVASVVLTFYPGPNYGTDFRGGTEIEVAFTQPVDSARIRKAVEESGFSTPDVVQVRDPANPNHFLIRVQDVSVVDEAAKEKLRVALCLTEDPKAPVANATACPPNARATEVKVSLGGDKIATRYESEPDLERSRSRSAASRG